MSIFTDNKTALESHGFVVQDENTVLGPQGQPVAGMDAYGQVWFKEEGIEAICNGTMVEEPKEQEVEMVRARNDKGHYIKDDPSTPENEAWTTKIIKKVLPSKKGKKKKGASNG